MAYGDPIFEEIWPAARLSQTRQGTEMAEVPALDRVLGRLNIALGFAAPIVLGFFVVPHPGNADIPGDFRVLALVGNRSPEQLRHGHLTWGGSDHRGAVFAEKGALGPEICDPACKGAPVPAVAQGAAGGRCPRALQGDL